MNAKKIAPRHIRTIMVWLGAFALACYVGVPVVCAQEKSSSQKKDKDGKKKTPREGAKGIAKGTPSQSDSETKDELAEAIAEAAQTEKKGGAQIDPELQKRIDELLKKAATQSQAKPPTKAPLRANPRSRQTQPPKRGRARPPSATRPNPRAPKDVGGTAIDIEPATDGVAPEARTYRFSIKNGTYEQLVEGFARQTGLGVIGQAPRDGKVSFVTTEELGFTEVLSRIRMLLFNYKPHDPYWLERRESHLAVVRVADFYRVLPVERMFPSLKKFRASGLPDDELVLVIYTPASGSVSDLSRARDFMPDYMRVTPLQERNAVTIFGLSKDIEKYMSVIDLFVLGSRSDPRVTAKIEVANLLPSEALAKLRQLMELDQLPTTSRGRAPRRGVEPSVLDNVPAPAVVLMPEDLLGYILVRAMQDKIDEIRLLLPEIDVATPSSDRTPVVIPLKYARADQLVTTLQQILLSVSGPSSGAVPSTPRRSRRKTSAGAGLVSARSITLLPHPSINAIVVMADSEEEVRQVRELIALFDVESNKQIRIELSYADPTEVTNTILAVLAGPAKKTPPDLPHVIPDPSGGAIYFTGSQTALERTRSIIAAVDVPLEPVILHVYALEKRLPSFVANILREYDNAIPQPQSVGAAKKRGTTRGGARRARKAVPVVSKFTADDEEMRLLVLCTDADWQHYVPLIQQLEDSVERTQTFVRLELTNIGPDAALERLSGLIPQLPGPAGGMRFAASDGAILVIDANTAELERVRAFLVEVDRPVTIEQRIFEIKHKDPSEIHQAIDALIATPTGSAMGRSKVRRRTSGAKTVTGPSGSSATQSGGLTIVELGNKLIVRATPSVLDEVAALIEQFDVEAAATEMRVYGDFPPGTDVIALSETVKTVVSGGRGRAPRAGTRAAAPGEAGNAPRLVPYPPSNKLIVIAEPSAFADIERVIDLFSAAVDAPPIEVAFVKLEYADPAAVIELVTPLLDIQIRRLVQTGDMEIGPDSGGPTMLSTKRRAGRVPGSGSGDKYHLAADGQNRRIVIAAPRSIVELATGLIEQFDEPLQADEVVFTTVTLNNAEPALMVKAVKEMIGATLRQSRKRVTAQGAQAAGSDTSMTLTITEAPAGGAIVLRGTKTDVEEAVTWIHKLDSMSSAGQLVRVFEVKTADIKNLVELILHMVETQPRGRNQSRVPAPPRRAGGLGGLLGDSGDDDIWETSKTWTGQDLFIQADLIDRTMLVATTESKMARIESLIKQIDEDPAIQSVVGAGDQQIPSFTYGLQYADAIDASWDADAVFDALFRSQQRPKVRTAYFGDNMIIVEHPDESRFDELRDLIATYIDKLPARDLELKTKTHPMPPGIGASDAVFIFKRDHPDIDIEVIDTTEEEKEYDIEEIKPLRLKDRQGARCLPSGALARMASYFALSFLAQQEDESDSESNDANLEPVKELTAPAKDANAQDEMIRRMVQEQLRLQAAVQPSRKDSTGDEGTPASAAPQRKSGGGVRLPAEKKKLQIYVDNNTGRIVVKGPKILVDEVNDWMDDLKEELEGGQVKHDIRIYRVRYIDVFTAQDIIEEMFNATKQQRSMVQQQQRLLQQQRARQQQQQARQRQQQQQQQQQQAGKGQQPNQPGRPGQQQQAQQPQPQMPQLPPTSVRVYPNPRDRTLIFRADTSQYPAILELLAKIDQPKPFDAELRIFHLEKLNAADVVETLTTLLGLGAKSGGARRSTPANARRGGRAGAQAAPLTGRGAHLPQTILEEVATGTGTLGVDPEDITLSSNDAANSIVVMAPPAALEYIGDLIDQLENEDIPTRETRYFELQHASVEDVLEYLTDHYAKAGRGTRSRSGTGARKASKGGGGGPVSTGDDLTSPTFIAYPRLNMLTVQAPVAVLDEVADLIVKLDVSSAQDQWSDVVLEHADAKSVADTLAQMFGEGGGGAKAGRRGGASSGSGREAKFIGEEGGRIVLYRAPETITPQILDAVAKLEESASQTSSIRVLKLEHATASRVAEAIESAYGSSRGGSGRRGSSSTAQFSVTAHDPSHQLFIRSDQTLFDEIESLVETLDVPSGLGFEFRIYPLQYANAGDVHATLTQLVKGYIQQAGASAKDMPPFSVEVNEAANALVVLGGPQLFGFLEENLRKIDTPAAAEQREVHVVTLLTADASAVAKTLTEIFITATGKGRPGAGGGSPAISISAVQGSPSILVKCSKDKFAEIEPVIQQLDSEDAAAGEVRVVSLLYSDANEMNKALQETLKMPGGGGGRGGQKLVGGVRISALAQSNALVISGGKEQVANLEATVKQLDAAGEKGSVPQIIVLKHAKVAHILPMLQEMIGPSKGGRGGQPAPILASNEPLNALIVRASQADMAWIEGLIVKIDSPDYLSVPGIRVVQLQQGINISDLAEKIELSVNKVAESNQASAGRKGRTSSISVTPDSRTNSLIIAGDPALFGQAEELARTMEKMGPSGGRATIIISPKNIKIDEIERLIAQLTGAEAASGSGSRRSSGSSGSTNRPRRGTSPRRPRG